MSDNCLSMAEVPSYTTATPTYNVCILEREAGIVSELMDSLICIALRSSSHTTRHQSVF